MNLSAKFNLALRLLNHNCNAAGYRIMADAQAKTLDDVSFLVDMASDLVEPTSFVYEQLDRFDAACGRNDRKGMEAALLDAVWQARDANYVLAEALLHAAAVFFLPALEVLRPGLAWDEVAPETRAITVALALVKVAK